MTLWRAESLCILALSCMACAGDTEPPATTYWQDVAPLFAKHCWQCHSAGCIAPIRLDQYAQAQRFAASIASATRNRTMPPWSVTSDGSCGEFSHSLALSEDEIALIAAWVRDGAQQGEPREITATPRASLGDARELHTPLFVPMIQGGDYAASDEYRCFPVETTGDALEFITGYEILPGRPEIVHHLFLELVELSAESMDGTGRSNAEVLRALDDESPDRLGWPCFTGAGDGVRIEATPVVWAPGQGVVTYPDDSGVLLQPGRMMVAQIHYNLVDPTTRGMSDQTTIRLRVEPRVANLGMFVVIDPLLESLQSEPITLPPRQASTTFSWQRNGVELAIAESVTELQLRGVMPHMHQLGRKYRLNYQPDSQTRETCATDVQHWDFHWQRMYFFQDPLPLTRASQLAVTCDYDTSTATQPVSPGWSTQNEMCTTTLYMTLPLSAIGL